MGPSGAVVLLHNLNFPVAYASGTCLYVARQVTSGGPAGQSELLRIDEITGRVMARLRLGAQFDHALIAGDALWVTSSSGSSLWLWRLDPNSLAAIWKMTLPSNGNDDSAGSLAVAGGRLWIGTRGTVTGVSLTTGRVTGRIGLAHDDPATVAEDPAGRILLVSHGQAVSYLDRRDPHTGRLLARSAAFRGATRAAIGGIVAGRYAWISQSGGMQGYILRLDLTPLPSNLGWVQDRCRRCDGNQRHPGSDHRRDPLGHPVLRRRAAQLLRRSGLGPDPATVALSRRGQPAGRRPGLHLLCPERVVTRSRVDRACSDRLSLPIAPRPATLINRHGSQTPTDPHRRA